MLLSCLILLVATQTEPAGPKTLAVDGPFKEPLSSVEFPVAAGPWKRAKVLQFSQAPPDHSITYQLRDDFGVVATATGFVFPNQYPLPDALDIHFDSILRDVAGIGRGFELVRKLTITFGEGAAALEARVGMFVFHGGVGKSEEQRAEQLYLMKHDTYWIQWRVSSTRDAPKDLGEKVFDLIQALIPPK